MPHSEEYQEICSLMDLAWKNCASDVFAVVYMIIGGFLFSVSYLVVGSMMILDEFSKLPKDTDFGPVGDILYNAMFGALPRVAALLLFLAIIVILFEYALSFTTICYYYDNKSWAVPKLFRDTCDAVSNHFKSQRDENASADRKHRIYLENEILKIRNNTKKE